jgi:hypothetical protein
LLKQQDRPPASFTHWRYLSHARFPCFYAGYYNSLFLETGFLCRQTTKIKEFCPPDFAVPDYLDFIYQWRVEWESSLRATTVSDTTDGEVTSYSFLDLDNYALEDLNTFPFSLNNFCVTFTVSPGDKVGYWDFLILLCCDVANFFLFFRFSQ